jgi:ABC-type transport system involved in multi-copper enzyme maturation permease subunit
VLDRVSLTGAGKSWSTATVANRMGGGMPTPQPTKTGGTFTVTGSGDIAPVVAGPGGGGFPSATVSTHLIGAFAALIVVVVVAAMFMTTEYRRGLIRLTFAASPNRGRVLAAKAVVIAGVTFVVGLIAGIIVTIIGIKTSEASGVYVFPYTWLTAVRVVAGTAALLAVAAVLALAIATIVRRSAAAIAAVIVATVLPYILAVAVLPHGAANWLLRLTPAAGFAIQQAAPQYHQVTSQYAAASGYYPLAPWAGFAVLCGYAAVACFLAVRLLRRRDA